MKNYSQKPTEENALALLKTDPIERNKSVFNFITLLSRINESCTIAVNGEWGTGKTFFVKQTKLVLDAMNACSPMDNEKRNSVLACIPEEHPIKSADICFSTLYYDAWLHDHHDDPILSLVYAAVADHQSDFTLDKNRSVGESAAALAGVLTGRDFVALKNAASGEDFFASIKKVEDIQDLVKRFIDALIEEKGNRLVIFVDELDRCKPDYAVCFMERVKHYFDDDRITFVFSVSLSQLQATVKCYYGADFNATRYLDKFFDLRMSLPTPDVAKYMTNRLGLRSIYMEWWDKCLIALVIQHQLSLREIERYVRLIKICVLPEVGQLAFPRNPLRLPNDAEARFFAATLIIPIMLLLQMTDMSSYLDFIQGRSPNALLDFFPLYIESYPRGARYLLKEGEEYSNDGDIVVGQNRRVITTLSNRLSEIYHAFFNPLPVHRVYEGAMRIDFDEIKVYIERVISLLSNLADYEYK